MKAYEFIFESKQLTLGGFKVTPLHIEDQDVDEAIGLNAPHRRMSRDELQAYANRIKTDTKTKKDKFQTMNIESNMIRENSNSLFYNLKDKTLKKKNKYVFNYEMSTDGHAVSFLFLHKDYVEEEKTKKTNKKK